MLDRGVHLCLFSPWWIPRVCFCLPWPCYNLGNYRANKLGARPKRLAFWGSLTPWMCSESDQSPFLTSGCVTRSSQASFGGAQAAHFRQRAGRKGEEGGNRDRKVLWVRRNGPWSSGTRTAEPVLLQRIMLFAGGRHPFSCHELSDHMLSLSSCQATTCFRVPSEIPSDFVFKRNH